MSKTTIKELAPSLSDKHDLSKADAERFVSAIFEVINEGLENDKLVKVKGLGAFKIIGIAARKSVDVNTGEPIVIESRNKISFTPDASMRDDVNKPFSQFETVIINDGVDFSSIDKEYENENEVARDKQAETAPDAVSDNIPSLPTELIEEANTDKGNNKEQNTIEEEPSKDETLTESEPVDRDSHEKDNSEGMGTFTESETSVKSETSVENNSTTECGSSAERDIAIEKSNIEREVEQELINYKEARQSHVMKALAITAIAIIIACLCGGYYLFSQIQRRDSHIEMLEKQMRLVAQHQKKKSVAANPSKQIPQAKEDRDSSLSETDGKQEATKQVPQADNKQEMLKAESKEIASQEQYNKDVRIRTGAYAIVGIKKTVTVRSGQTMDGISRSNLGPGMECYLEAVNGGRRELKAGESINIPELKLKKRLR